MPAREIPTVTVVGSNTVARADGRTAIVLETMERGPIAFEVNLQNIELLRRQLTVAETVLRQSTKKQAVNQHRSGTPDQPLVNALKLLAKL